MIHTGGANIAQGCSISVAHGCDEQRASSCPPNSAATVAVNTGGTCNLHISQIFRFNVTNHRHSLTFLCENKQILRFRQQELWQQTCQRGENRNSCTDRFFRTKHEFSKRDSNSKFGRVKQEPVLGYFTEAEVHHASSGEEVGVKIRALVTKKKSTRAASARSWHQVTPPSCCPIPITTSPRRQSRARHDGQQIQPEVNNLHSLTHRWVL